MRNLTRYTLLGTVLILLTLGPAEAVRAQKKGKHAPAAATRSLESLLVAADVSFERAGAGKSAAFKIPLKIEDQTSVVYAVETSLGEGKAAESMRVARFMVPIDLPTLAAGSRPPPAMLRKMAELNGSYVVGKAAICDGGVYYVSELWLRTADARSVSHHLLLSHYTGRELRKQLLPFLEE